MRVERRKFPLFLPDFGAILYFFTEFIVASRVQGGKYRGLPPMRGIVRMLQSLLRGGGRGMGLCEVYRETTKICVIRSEFSPMALDTFTSRRKLNITVLEGVYVYKVHRDSQNLSSDPTFLPIAPDTFTSRRKKYHNFGRNDTFTCYLQLSRKSRPCSSQCAVQSWKPEETQQHHSTELEAN